MKKLLTYISLAIAFIVVMSACTEDFLDRYPLDEIAPQTFWKTPQRFEIVCQ